MHIELQSAVFWLAACLALLMGFAIQRGGTCTVAAIEEIVTQRRCERLLSLLEASLWVAGGLLLASVLKLAIALPQGHAIAWTTCVGAVLLGLGGVVNRACVVGTVARLGSGEWAYLATPFGFYAGCVAFHAAPMLAPAGRLGMASPVLAAASWSALLVVLLMLGRVAAAVRRTRSRGASPLAWLNASTWAPAAATVVIGVAFVALLVVVGEGWGYSDVLAELARGAVMHVRWRGALLLALFAGALLAGYSAGKWAHGSWSPARLARCACGGFLMGFGSLMIPGSNDGLVLLGLPLLWPHAWLAFVIMCATIGGALLLQRRLKRL